MNKKVLVWVAIIIAIVSPLVIYANQTLFLGIAVSEINETTSPILATFLLALTLACEFLALFLFIYGILEKK